MSKKVVVVLVAALLVAVAITDASAQCYLPYVVQRPSPTATKRPTRTPFWVDTATPEPTATWAPSSTPAPTRAGPVHLRGRDVIEAFRQNDLTVDGVTSENVAEDDYTCTMFEWGIPQYGSEAKGFMMDCTDQAEREVAEGWVALGCIIYPDKCPHSYGRANIYLGIRPVVPVAYANRYGDVLARVE